MEDLAQQVAKEPELFDRLFYKIDLRSLNNRKLMYLPAEPQGLQSNDRGSIRQIQDSLREMLPLLLRSAVSIATGWKMLSMQHLMDEANKRVAKIKTFGGDDDFLGQWAVLCQQAGDYLHDPSSYRNPWISIIPRNEHEDFLEKPHYLLSAGTANWLTLLVRPRKEMDGFTFAQKSIDRLRTILDEYRSRAIRAWSSG